jgi:CRP-like cAMP-binding protein
MNKRLVAGDTLDEVAIFSDHAMRSTTVVCEDKCELLRMTGEKVLELFYQDKTFAFQIARALSRYVVENTEQVADKRAAILSNRRAALV